MFGSISGPMPRWLGGAVLVAALGGGCASTTPSPPPAEETLVVLNAGDATLTLLPVSTADPTKTIILQGLGGDPVRFAAESRQALVTTGVGNTATLVDFPNARVGLVFHLATGAGAGGAAFVSDTLAYVANPLANRATRLNLRSGDTASVAVGRTPTAIAIARGRVFIANANLDSPCAGPAPCVLGPSWLTVIDPEQNTVIDSIPLPGPGNASDIRIGGDGLLYVLSAGPGGTASGRLSIVDPVVRQEVGSFSGFGVLPNRLASDGRERLFVTSLAEGLMEFNTRTRRVVRGAGAGIPLQNGVAAAVDGNGLVYAVESGPCAFPGRGRVRVFRPDLTEARSVPTGLCSADAAIVKLPPPP
jgi:hypothetical protein